MKKQSIPAVILLILSLVIAIGSQTFLSPCVHDDGAFGSCHWAGQALLGLGCALVTFIVGSIAVIVPTPNGAGPWHFAVKTMLILYGVQDEHALYFVLIVHTVQTMLVVALGIYAWLALNFTKEQKHSALNVTASGIGM
jgi:hypothetical protein